MVKLRPHHGLCMQFFEGKGYSNDFTAHMAAVIERLTVENSVITLIDGLDEVCGHCPNYRNEMCISQEKVHSYDEAVLRYTGLSYGDAITYQELTQKVRENILDAGCFHAVCGDCGWSDICHKIY